MIKKIFFASALTFIGFNQANAQSLVTYVETMAGTGKATTPAALKHSSGFAQYANTIPAVTTPFAMTQWTPQTQTSENKCIPPYYYKDDLFNGIRGSHWLSGSCTQDYGSVTIMPITGKLLVDAGQYSAKFSHADEVASPYEYQIDLKKYNVKASVTSTDRCGILKFTATKADSLYLLITPNSDYKKGFIKVDEKTGEIYGYNPVHRIYQGWGKEAGFDGHFVVQVNRKSQTSGTFADGKASIIKMVQKQNALGAFIGFNVEAGETIIVKVGTSFSNLEGARKNLQTEIPAWDYDGVKAKNKAVWENKLSAFKITTSSEKDKRIFYTSYYHALQQPRLFNDVDGTYPKFASDHQLAKITNGNYYDDFSLWDTYRAHIPLLELVQPKMVDNISKSLIIKGQQGGYLPIFPCWNSYTSEMIGDHCTSVISSAYLKGIGTFNMNEAYRLMRQNAFDLPKTKEEYVEGKGRRALDSYLRYKYIPVEDSVADAFHQKEQVSRVLEYAYDDFALAQVSKKLGKQSDYKSLLERSHYYQNVFDKQVNLVRGRHENGNWVTPFKADGKEYYITEGTPRQYTFYVPHDVAGLAKLMGGDNQLEHSLDTLFTKGEYWHGNEPGHQTPFMYNFTNAPWKTQQYVKEILDKEYSDGPGGLGGNDDAGQMSAWYIFASMGFYPLNPVSGEYLLTAPKFDAITLTTEKGKQFQVIATRKVKDAQYISSVKLNGKPYTKNYISYLDIVNGGKLEIQLQDKPNAQWGIGKANQPSSLSK